jgi:hypothetical protein
MYKICSKCNEEKSVTEFSWRNKEKGTRTTRCKQCHRDYSNTHYKDNTNDYKKRSREARPEQRRKIKEYMIQYLREHPCVDCGETDIEVLEFDHIIMVGSKARRVTQCTSISSLIDEIAKCEIRCANCHTRRTRKMLGWLREDKF